ncbi:glycoside hydrolase family 10 protein [Armillaria gallica]|uniref:Glycoside hydrolase family 10 protein n=1 Tax=Armillaria gallica TaxID=47427 RepID=A0A2H3DP84_ARMGA|nr:glycoside hydrolase family 10 protein [Armillaria gallica]
MAKGKLFWGAAADQDTISISVDEAILKSKFGTVTPENSMKWDVTESTQGTFTISGSNYLVNWAVLNSKKILWYSLSLWVSAIMDADTLTSIIQMHIAKVAGQYSGKLYGNKVLNEDGTLQSSVFYNILGESFITIVFKAAQAADLTAKLYVNDYNLDSNNTKVQGMIALVKWINADKQLINSICVQICDHFADVAVASIDVAITELDISNAKTSDYTTIVDACLSNSACVSITSWGVSDANSWHTHSMLLLFYNSYKPNDVYMIVISDLY